LLPPPIVGDRSRLGDSWFLDWISD